MQKLLAIIPLISILIWISIAFAMPTDLMDRLWDRPAYKQIKLEYHGRIMQFKIPPKMEDFSQGKFVKAANSPLSDLMSLHYSLDNVDYYVLLEKEGFEILALACGFVVLNTKVFNYWIYHDGIPEPSTFRDVQQLEKQRISKEI